MHRRLLGRARQLAQLIERAARRIRVGLGHKNAHPFARVQGSTAPTQRRAGIPEFADPAGCKLVRVSEISRYMLAKFNLFLRSGIYT